MGMGAQKISDLKQALNEKDLDRVCFLLSGESQDSLTQKCLSFKTPLLCACELGDGKVVKFLLTHHPIALNAANSKKEKKEAIQKALKFSWLEGRRDALSSLKECCPDEFSFFLTAPLNLSCLDDVFSHLICREDWSTVNFLYQQAPTEISANAENFLKIAISNEEMNTFVYWLGKARTHSNFQHDATIERVLCCALYEHQYEMFDCLMEQFTPNLSTVFTPTSFQMLILHSIESIDYMINHHNYTLLDNFKLKLDKQFKPYTPRDEGYHKWLNFLNLYNAKEEKELFSQELIAPICSTTHKQSHKI